MLENFRVGLQLARRQTRTERAPSGRSAVGEQSRTCSSESWLLQGFGLWSASGRPAESGASRATFHFVFGAKTRMEGPHLDFTGFTCATGASSVGSPGGSGLVNYLEQAESFSGGLLLRQRKPGWKQTLKMPARMGAWVLCHWREPTFGSAPWTWSWSGFHKLQRKEK